MALSITDLKKGTVFEFESAPYKVIDYKQKVMGRGGSIVNVRIKSLIDGRVYDKTFKGNEQLDSADVTRISVEYLYSDDNSFYFMDNKTFQQYEVSSSDMEDQKSFVKEGDQVQLVLFKDNPISVELPKNVPLKVTYTEDVVKGDTANSLTKDATLETGVNVKVPSFIKIGDTVSVDTRTKDYVERVK